jgi:stage II sporulation protein P
VNRTTRWLILLLALVFCASLPVEAAKLRFGEKKLEWSTIYDEQTNAVVWYTGWQVEPGDEFLTEENKKYEVVRAEGNNAWARYVQTIKLSAYLPKEEKSLWAELRSLLPGYLPVQEQPRKMVIYHSHSDESYIPSDGTESKAEGGGGIYKVGAAMASALQAQGIQVTQSPANHNPHDDNAYDRSRRTAMSLISQQKPDAIFDIHRDAAPPDAYATKVNGEDVSKVQVVVGKYNPQMKANEEFALKMKAASDQKYPGLVKGIFYAKGGDYNQDLSPRALLLEVGAHTNNRDSAERGASMLANVVPAAVYGGGGGGGGGTPAPVGAPGAAPAGASGSTKAIGWIVGVVVVGGLAFLLISAGSMKDAGSKVSQFWNTEFANLVGLKGRRKKKNSDPDKEDGT